MSTKIPSLQARLALRTLGRNIKTARLKRRISVQSFAKRTGASASTIMRLEKGDPGVSVGTLAMAALALGEIKRISDFLDASSDSTGLLLAREALPKRIDGRRKRGTAKARARVAESPAPYGDDAAGMAF